MNKCENVKDDKCGFWISILKGIIWAILISLVCVLIFAFIIKIAGLSSSIIKPINQVIKIISVFIGVFFALKFCKSKSLLKGVIIGGAYSLVSFLLFSILNGSFLVNFTIITDLMFLSISGAISGVIVANIFKK